ncbi:ATPase family associated with various cellular activities (AAA) [Halogeometricum limi]|uniref:ATPase family associated with various cellular activities (AAA) n=2 Tax=Halogeometricum limi TaxID=555875 RepID=A0A1I6I8Z9_9EURY|nr:ATPase family associated with various cellular activities (AAA) [Halogeometricum limi]
MAYLCADGTVRQGYRLGDARPLRSLGRIQYAWDRERDGEQTREYVTTAGFLVRDGQLVAANVAATLHFERVVDAEHVETFADACQTRPDEIRSTAAAQCRPETLRANAADAVEFVNNAARGAAEQRYWGQSRGETPIGRDGRFEQALSDGFHAELRDALEAEFEWASWAEATVLADITPKRVRGVVRFQRGEERGPATAADVTEEMSETVRPAGDEATASDAEQWLSEPDLTFDDVAAMREVKDRLRQTVLDPLRDPELFETYGLGTINGILLHGPPGTGKTYLSRALAGELDRPFLRITPANVTSKFVGESADKVAEVFEVARAHQPSIVFIDELDALGTDRGATHNTQSERQMQNQLLVELAELDGDDVVVVGATNKLEELDEALTRTGRFDEWIAVPLPNAESRLSILLHHLRERPTDIEDSDLSELATKTHGFSASDIESVANEAARRAIDETYETGTRQPIAARHLTAAVEATDSHADRTRNGENDRESEPRERGDSEPDPTDRHPQMTF